MAQNYASAGRTYGDEERTPVPFPAYRCKSTAKEKRGMSTLTHPIYALPIGPRDQAYLWDALDKLWDDPVHEDEFEEALAGPYGREVYRAWEAARTTPLVRYADRRPAKTLEDFGHFAPIPSRQDVLGALTEAANAWKEELL